MRALRVLVELPVRKDQANAEILHRLRMFTSGDLDGVVFSDKAGGLDRFCEAEEILERGMIREIKQAYPNLAVWNVLRTGDRCSVKLNLVLQQLKQQGSSNVLLVSGHDYRTKLRLRANAGERCTRICSMNKAHQKNILCGKEASRILSDDAGIVADITLGGVLHDVTTVALKPRASFYITQACPPVDAQRWTSNLTSTTCKPVFVTVIPILSLKELSRVRALGSNIPIEVDSTLSHPFSREKGLEMAKSTVNALKQLEGVAGVYLYHHDIEVLPELAQLAKAT